MAGLAHGYAARSYSIRHLWNVSLNETADLCDEVISRTRRQEIKLPVNAGNNSRAETLN